MVGGADAAGHRTSGQPGVLCEQHSRRFYVWLKEPFNFSEKQEFCSHGSGPIQGMLGQEEITIYKIHIIVFCFSNIIKSPQGGFFLLGPSVRTLSHCQYEGLPRDSPCSANGLSVTHNSDSRETFAVGASLVLNVGI